MLFLDQFQSISYEVDGIKNSITNITKAFLIDHLSINKSLLLQLYTVKELETPESVAYDLYGDATYHWTILMINNIVDPFTEWCQTDERVYEMTSVKYQTGANGIHHYVNVTNGKICDDVTRKTIEDSGLVPSEVIPITNYEYELKLNNSRREILVINPVVIERVALMLEEMSANAS